jgi:hypothetical protein
MTTITQETVTALIDELDAVAVDVLSTLGQDAIATIVARLGRTYDTFAKAAASPNPALAVEVAGADATADAEIAQKFGAGPGVAK